ncbi:LOW QUALITY PROTEIN: hypothetical protein O9K51_00077 [Purpureocillium lavendulum]|uniref:Uncharacterized protein n=1 Tax=Purpureocillium lavendulum TaxID=1247861 RepID=A0AB34G0X6_9HYPO|nr:LOW QUALITY PROTEIN: hypothetical protein O9K51_00077 [Purpureocillium lavendulum]
MARPLCTRIPTRASSVYASHALALSSCAWHSSSLRRRYASTSSAFASPAVVPLLLAPSPSSLVAVVAAAAVAGGDPSRHSVHAMTASSQHLGIRYMGDPGDNNKGDSPVVRDHVLLQQRARLVQLALGAQQRRRAHRPHGRLVFLGADAGDDVVSRGAPLPAHVGEATRRLVGPHALVPAPHVAHLHGRARAHGVGQPDPERLGPRLPLLQLALDEGLEGQLPRHEALLAAHLRRLAQVLLGLELLAAGLGLVLVGVAAFGVRGVAGDGVGEAALVGEQAGLLDAPQLRVRVAGAQVGEQGLAAGHGRADGLGGGVVVARVGDDVDGAEQAVVASSTMPASAPLTLRCAAERHSMRTPRARSPWKPTTESTREKDGGVRLRMRRMMPKHMLAPEWMKTSTGSRAGCCCLGCGGGGEEEPSGRGAVPFSVSFNASVLVSSVSRGGPGSGVVADDVVAVVVVVVAVVGVCWPDGFSLASTNSSEPLPLLLPLLLSSPSLSRASSSAVAHGLGLAGDDAVEDEVGLAELVEAAHGLDEALVEDADDGAHELALGADEVVLGAGGVDPRGRGGRRLLLLVMAQGAAVVVGGARLAVGQLGGGLGHDVLFEAQDGADEEGDGLAEVVEGRVALAEAGPGAVDVVVHDEARPGEGIAQVLALAQGGGGIEVGDGHVGGAAVVARAVAAIVAAAAGGAEPPAERHGGGRSCMRRGATVPRPRRLDSGGGGPHLIGAGSIQWNPPAPEGGGAP